MKHSRTIFTFRNSLTIKLHQRLSTYTSFGSKRKTPLAGLPLTKAKEHRLKTNASAVTSKTQRMVPNFNVSDQHVTSEVRSETEISASVLSNIFVDKSNGRRIF